MQDSYFDQLIRTKFQSYEVPNGPSDWDALAKRLDADFDAAFAEKLTTASVAYDPADWEGMEEKLTHPSDAVIREKLEGHEVPFEPADWAAMAENLTHPSDAVIREKLEGHEVPFVPADWAAMEENLMHPSDAVIREKLEGHEVPFEPADWAVMSAAMPNPFDMAVQAKLTDLNFASFDANWAEMGAQLDADFDADIRTQMNQVQIEPAGGDWNAMAALLGAEKPIAWYQRLAPVMDAALLLLLALFWWGGSGSGSVPTDILQAYDSRIQTPIIEQDEASVPADSHAKKSIQASTTVDKVDAHADIAQAKANTGVQPQQPVSAPSNQQVARSISLETSGVEIEKDSNTVSEEDVALIPASASVDKDRISQDLGYRLTALDHPSAFYRIHIPVSPLAIGTEEKRLSIPGLRIGATATILSSAAEFNDRGLRGYLTGLRVELPINEKISIISGLQVGEKHFDRMKLNVATDNSGLNRQPTYWVSRLQGHVKLLEIPVLLRYKFSTDKKINFYFQGGFSPVITLDEEYLHYDPRSAGNLSQTASRSDIDFTTAKDNPALETYLNSLQPNREVHTTNTYVGFLQIAPGAEVKFAPHLSLQVEPYIQLGLQRTGSARQRIHSLGGTVSLMYHFPNK